MITRIHISNYKSVQDLDLDLGRFNVLIGENGCGKTNILEAISLGAAAASDKLDHEFLASRGIRVAEPEMMRSAFPAEKPVDGIEVGYSRHDGAELSFQLRSTGEPYAKWTSELDGNFTMPIVLSFTDPVTGSDVSTEPMEWRSIIDQVLSLNESQKLAVHEQTGMDSGRIVDIYRTVSKAFRQRLAPGLFENGIVDFILYSPENSTLRTFEAEGQLLPLGIRGEGLFKLLRVFSQREGQPEIKRLNELLTLIDWFEDFNIPDDMSNGQRHITLGDRFLVPKNGRLDQRSANEGFLFLLFYFSLFLSPETPSFFAIDNIDTSLNPKLCSELVKRLVELSKEHGKQVIVTTHNPALLDGLNLNDPDQRLMVVSRNRKGLTRVRRVEPPRIVAGEEPVRLSEAFLRGYLGGLPSNF